MEDLEKRILIILCQLVDYRWIKNGEKYELALPSYYIIIEINFVAKITILYKNPILKIDEIIYQTTNNRNFSNFITTVLDNFKKRNLKQNTELIENFLKLKT